MDHFPSDSEHLAASALLVLSSPSPCQFDTAQVKPQMIGAKSDQRGAARSSHSNSSSSTTSMITAGGSTEETFRPWFRSSNAIVARYREMRLKVSLRNRSKRYLICKIKLNDSTNMAEAVKDSWESAQEAASETSCLSISSEPCHEEITTNTKKEVTSGHLWCRAEAILGFLKSGGCDSEVRIRQVLGDTPDTSKALRILLKQEQIGRSGGGGRSDPYIYQNVDGEEEEDEDKVVNLIAVFENRVSYGFSRELQDLVLKWSVVRPEEW